MAAFVRQAREELTAFGPVDFDATCWIVKGRSLRSSGTKVERIWFTRHSDGYRTAQEGFPEPFASFVRAVVRHRDSRTVTGLKVSDHSCMLRACRYLFEQIGPRSADPTDLTPTDFEAAAAAARHRELPKSAYQTGCKLDELARSIDRRGLTAVTLDWRSPIPFPQENGGPKQSRIGPAFDAQRARKLPSEQILDALADISNADLEKPDLLRQRAVELLCCGGFRITELLLMQRDCWVEEPQRDEQGNLLLDSNEKPIVRCGLRYHPAKGGHVISQIKWLPTAMADVARRAVEEILRITNPFAELARFMAEHPEETSLGEPWDSYEADHLLTTTEIGRAIGSAANRLETTGSKFCRTCSIPFITKERNNSNKSGAAKQYLLLVRKDDLVGALVRRSNFAPILRPGSAPQPLHKSLFVVPIGYFHVRRPAIRGTVTTVTDENIDYYLNGSGKVKSIFGRLGYQDDQGKELSVTSHQFRHWLNTLAQEGGLSQHEVARWMGRRRIDQNGAYDHVSGRQLARRVFEKVMGGKSEGPITRTASRLDPVRREEFVTSRIHTAHVTDIGICILDWAMMPCPKHGACATCEEHLIDKGYPGQKEAAAFLREETAATVATAEIEQRDGTYGVDNWLEHHQRTLARLDRILAVHDDPSIPDGTLVQLDRDGAVTILLDGGTDEAA